MPEFSLINGLLEYGEAGLIIGIVVYCTRWIIKEQSLARSNNDSNQNKFIQELQQELRNLREIHNAEVQAHQLLRIEFSKAIEELNKVRNELHQCCLRQQHLEKLLNRA